MLAIPNSPSCVFSFWVGMPYSTQYRILKLCAACPTVDTITVFRDRKWIDPDKGENAADLKPLTTTTTITSVVSLIQRCGGSGEEAQEARAGWQQRMEAFAEAADVHVQLGREAHGLDLPPSVADPPTLGTQP